MFHVDNNSAVPVMPAVKPVVSAVTSFFTEGGNGVPPTYPGPDWFNIIQSELLAVLAAAGITPDKANNVQLLAAMRALFLDTSQNGADIQDKALFLQNLGLGEGAPAIGVPFFWPSAAMPNTVIDSWSSMVFLKFNGASFSATDYPVLAKVFPSLVLPEARGDFIRIWDDGRGVDGGRTLLSAQDFAQQRITGGFMGGAMGGSGSIKAGALVNSYLSYGASSQDLRHFSIDSAIETKTASETRPRNIAFNFLVRAK
ncbi:integrase [Citrobacter portucalensis]|uniref:integrase n=1 Tax=Citrobacter portucalensis TaxID=1639133 RepID=UPI0038B3E572